MGSAQQPNHRHEFYAEWSNHPIALLPDSQWRVIETRVVTEEYLATWGEFPTGGAEKRYRPVFQHLVERI